jgi:hypothetical protein
MPNVMTDPTNFQRRINNYVSGMMYSADVNYNGATRVNLGTPQASNATIVSNGGTIVGNGTIVDLSQVPAFPEPYGRTVTIVAGGASTTVVSLYGWDYLGQPVREDLTLNGATPVVGKKAFKQFQNYVTGTGTAGGTVNIGSGAGFGLPYKCLRVGWEVANGQAAAAGTLTPAVLTDPQTSTTGDPRGTYVPTTTPNGATILSVICDFVNDVNTARNGGLHGIRQFTA